MKPAVVWTLAICLAVSALTVTGVSRQNAFVGYAESTISHCEDVLDTNLCREYKSSGMCSTGTLLWEA